MRFPACDHHDVPPQCIRPHPGQPFIAQPSVDSRGQIGSRSNPANGLEFMEHLQVQHQCFSSREHRPTVRGPRTQRRRLRVHPPGRGMVRLRAHGGRIPAAEPDLIPQRHQAACGRYPRQGFEDWLVRRQWDHDLRLSARELGL